MPTVSPKAGKRSTEKMAGDLEVPEVCRASMLNLPGVT